MNNAGNGAAKKFQNRNAPGNINKKKGSSQNNRGINNGSSKSKGKKKKSKKSKKGKKKKSNNSNNKMLSGNKKEDLKQVMNTFQDDFIKINQTFERLNSLLKQLAE